MFHYLYYPVTIYGSKEKFSIAFCCFLVIKNIVEPSYYSDFPIKLVCWGILVFICLRESIPMSL